MLVIHCVPNSPCNLIVLALLFGGALSVVLFGGALSVVRAVQLFGRLAVLETHTLGY